MSRYTFGYTLVAALLFFIAPVSVAFASISTLPNAPTTPQPFGFYCTPYTFSFTATHHYEPGSNPSCTYALPLLGNRELNLYQGTPGSATVVSQDLYTGPSTVVETSPNNIGTPAPETDFFAVVYDSSLDQGSGAFDQYLRTGGTIPSGAQLNVNYWILPFKYGPVPQSELEPVVIIPDTMGSWDKSSGPVIDPIFNTYQNLIDTLEQNGYVMGQTLFTFPYNWEASNTTSAQLLATTIASIKGTCACGHVDLIGHGMGGTIAMQYVESPAYQNDVDQLIFLGTPLEGTPSAYSAWEAGQIENGNFLQSALVQTFLTQEAKNAGLPDAFTYIHSTATSFQQLLPTYNYLFQMDSTPLTYPTGYPRNTFLENLLNNFSGWHGVRTSNFAGDDLSQDTPGQLFIDTSSNPPLWPDGETQGEFDVSGDSFVPTQSITNFLNIDQTFSGSTHSSLPTDAEGAIFHALTLRDASALVNNDYTVSSVLFIDLTSASGNVEVIDPNGERLGVDPLTGNTLSEIPGAFYSGFNGGNQYVIIPNPQFNSYNVEIGGTAPGSFTLNVNSVGQNTNGSVTGTTTTGIITGYAVNKTTQSFPPFGTSLNFVPLDLNPPIPTISSPQNGASYFHNATVPVTVSINDPDGDAVATSTYTLDGALINPQNPIVLSTLPLGTSTLAVYAIDAFGNATTSTSSFAVMKAPLSVSADNIVMTQNNPTPPFTATLSGFVNGDTATSSDVTGQASCTSTGSGASAPGQYPITCTKGTLSSNNYSFVGFTPGMLTVQAPPAPTKSFCILVLGSSGFKTSGNANLNAVNCVLQVDASGENVFTASGNAVVKTIGNIVKGSVKESGNASVTPKPETGASARPDPFASMTKPTVGSTCDHTNYVAQSTSAVTIAPGVYCGGITVSGSANVTFSPGLYILKNGGLNTSGNARLTGSGVSFYLTGTNATLNGTGQSIWNFKAMSTGSLAGFVFYLDPLAASGTSQFSGNTILSLEGIVYLAKDDLQLSGNASSGQAAPFTAYLANSLTMSGNAAFNINGSPANTTLPIPFALSQ